jgi:hypothetical protein
MRHESPDLPLIVAQQKRRFFFWSVFPQWRRYSCPCDLPGCEPLDSIPPTQPPTWVNVPGPTMSVEHCVCGRVVTAQPMSPCSLGNLHFSWLSKQAFLSFVAAPPAPGPPRFLYEFSGPGSPWAPGDNDQCSQLEHACLSCRKHPQRAVCACVRVCSPTWAPHAPICKMQPISEIIYLGNHFHDGW